MADAPPQARSRVLHCYMERLRKNDPTLKKIILWDANIGDQYATELARLVGQNSVLRSLNLRQNCIGSSGASALAEMLLVNRTLESLILGENQIGNEGTEALANALQQNSTLSSLVLTKNGIGDPGARALSTALRQNSTLTELNLNNNDIRVEGSRALADAVLTNDTIRKVELESNHGVDNEAMSKLSERLDVNDFFETAEQPDVTASEIRFMPRLLPTVTPRRGHGNVPSSHLGYPNDPDWKIRIRHKQQRLLLLHHSSKCLDAKCKVTPYCGEMKKLWKHMARCTDNECCVAHCFSSRSILSHYRKCKDPRCPACGPVREAVRKSRRNNGPGGTTQNQCSAADGGSGSGVVSGGVGVGSGIKGV